MSQKQVKKYTRPVKKAIRVEAEKRARYEAQAIFGFFELLRVQPIRERASKAWRVLIGKNPLK
jgi:hypothetical protein